MEINFRKQSAKNFRITKSTVILSTDRWDDFGFRTLFSATFMDANGVTHDLGGVKIGFKGQLESRTADSLDDSFLEFSEDYFSLGQDAIYYRKLFLLDRETRESILSSLRDVVFLSELLDIFGDEPVFKTSLIRDISKSTLGQFRRVLGGGVVLTKFNFTYRQVATENTAGYDLSFKVIPDSKPSTNIHVLIGRNGVGKTTLLNNMVSAIILGRDEDQGGFFEDIEFFETPIDDDYFGGVASVSFSAFDPFIPLPEQNDREKGLTNFYIGLKKLNGDSIDRTALPKTSDDLVS